MTDYCGGKLRTRKMRTIARAERLKEVQGQVLCSLPAREDTIPICFTTWRRGDSAASGADLISLATKSGGWCLFNDKMKRRLEKGVMVKAVAAVASGWQCG